MTPYTDEKPARRHVASATAQSTPAGVIMGAFALAIWGTVMLFMGNVAGVIPLSVVAVAIALFSITPPVASSASLHAPKPIAQATDNSQAPRPFVERAKGWTTNKGIAIGIGAILAAQALLSLFL